MLICCWWDQPEPYAERRHRRERHHRRQLEPEHHGSRHSRTGHVGGARCRGSLRAGILPPSQTCILIPIGGSTENGRFPFSGRPRRSKHTNNSQPLKTNIPCLTSTSAKSSSSLSTSLPQALPYATASSWPSRRTPPCFRCWALPMAGTDRRPSHCPTCVEGFLSARGRAPACSHTR